MSMNQIGILFNFLAGFLLAPDIFGTEKLLGWEKTLKTSLFAIEEYLTRVFFRFVSSDGKKPQYRFYTLFASIFTFSILCVLIAIWAIPYRLLLESESLLTFIQNAFNNRYAEELGKFAVFFVLIIIGSALLIYREFIWHVKGKAKVSIPFLTILLFSFSLGILGVFNTSLGYVLLAFLGTLVYGILLAGLLLLLLIGVLGMTMDFIIGTISTKEGIKGTFTVFGVISFVLGNVLQFLAG